MQPFEKYRGLAWTEGISSQWVGSVAVWKGFGFLLASLNNWIRHPWNFLTSELWANSVCIRSILPTENDPGALIDWVSFSKSVLGLCSLSIKLWPYSTKSWNKQLISATNIKWVSAITKWQAWKKNMKSLRLYLQKERLLMRISVTWQSFQPLYKVNIQHLPVELCKVSR